MAEPRRLATLDDDELGTALRALGEALGWPVGRDIAPLVIERLRTQAGEGRLLPRPTPPRLPRLRLALVVAAALLALLAAAAAAGVLGLPGIRILVGGSVGAPEPSTTSPIAGSPTPAPSGPLGRSLGLGRPVDPASLDQVVGRHVPLPAGLGRPASAWLDTNLGVTVVSLAWPASADLPATDPLTTREPGIGAILTEIPATVDGALLEKVLGDGATIETAEVNGRVGYWIGGAPHGVLVLGRDGQIVALDTRLAGNTLLWTQGGLTFRLESALTRDAAVALAATIG